TLSLGYKLSSEEQSPADLVRYAQMAEDSAALADPATSGTTSLHRVCRRPVRILRQRGPRSRAIPERADAPRIGRRGGAGSPAGGRGIHRATPHLPHAV